MPKIQCSSWFQRCPPKVQCPWKRMPQPKSAALRQQTAGSEDTQSKAAASQDEATKNYGRNRARGSRAYPPTEFTKEFQRNRPGRTHEPCDSWGALWSSYMLVIKDIYLSTYMCISAYIYIYIHMWYINTHSSIRPWPFTIFWLRPSPGTVTMPVCSNNSKHQRPAKNRNFRKCFLVYILSIKPPCWSFMRYWTPLKGKLSK